MKSEFEHSWLTHEHFFSLLKSGSQQNSWTAIGSYIFYIPFTQRFTFSLSFVFSLCLFPFFLLSLSLPLNNLFVEKENFFFQDHFHVTFYFLTFMGFRTVQVLKSLKISSPHHQLRQNNLLDEFQCYCVNCFVVL